MKQSQPTSARRQKRSVLFLMFSLCFCLLFFNVFGCFRIFMFWFFFHLPLHFLPFRIFHVQICKKLSNSKLLWCNRPKCNTIFNICHFIFFCILAVVEFAHCLPFFHFSCCHVGLVFTVSESFFCVRLFHPSIVSIKHFLEIEKVDF